MQESFFKWFLFATFDAPCLIYVSKSYDKWWTKNNVLGSIFLERIFFLAKKLFDLSDFPKIPIYDFNEIYVDNPQIKLVQPI